ncbi:uncharacterized protein [Elaeis guineensis]|uniref:LOW QUALITY PROTEIN: transmembrane protein 53 n=1 Tax=Elaeis guineensis var. tenera TaxID=51953 RepID=A0A8N4IIV7_ELAGV|nr:LOW QUALITY PROTEIN: transmembrane protein 53 [Elaeis guineensis]
MEASVSVRFLGSTAAFHRCRLPLSRRFIQNPNPRILTRNGGLSPISPLLHFPSSNAPSLPRTALRSAPLPSSPLPPFGFFLSFSFFPIFPSAPPQERLDCFNSEPEEGFLQWDRSWEGLDGGSLRFCGGKGASWTVVLLGWLGAEQRHLKKYAEMYNSKGIRSVRFVVPVKDVVGFDLGRKIEGRIAGLTRELVSWCSEREEDGRERHLLFHTFSNTGWLAYGQILENLRSRTDIIEKIGGCIIDSGPAPEISPQVWAAGFCAALLKKDSSLTHSSVKPMEEGKMNGDFNRLNTKDIRPRLIEMILLSILAKFFSILLMLPDVNRRLSKVISILSKDQPLCPQLYLYSSADKVIPVHLVESFVMEQKALGRNVYTHDFGSSSHVNHFRSYPHIYSAKVYEFIKECCSARV